MDSGNVSAIISATAGLIGVIVGNSFVAVKEYLAGHRSRRENTLYLGILVVSHLERFANGCLAVAEDDGTERGRPAGTDGQHTTTTKVPEFLPLSLSVDWKLLPAELLYPILRIPDDQESLQNWLEGFSENDDDYPDHTEYFWIRRQGYAELGLKVEELAEKLRSHCEMPTEKSDGGEWKRTQRLRGVAVDINRKRAAYERRQSGL
ncbi:hypothetical protein CUU62_26200 [Pseudomonas sp. WP001]|nr:hypothetical protein CUU62_26200 [Pseudomonas sp. WP001]